jgi:hypothetical protein
MKQQIIENLRVGTGKDKNGKGMKFRRSISKYCKNEEKS